MPDEPAVSFVVAADRWETLQPLALALGRLGDADRVELVAVLTRNGPDADPPPGLDALGDVRVVEVDELEPIAEARAAGVRRARAPIVAIGETHCFPEPGWATATIAAHARGAAIVGPRIENANPATARSWSGLFLDYGTHIAIDRERPVGDVAGHNASYRRELLDAYGAGLGARLAYQSGICTDHRGRAAIVDDPAVGMWHWNAASVLGWLRERLDGGRTTALSRRTRWGAGRRAAYVAGSPLIPVVKLARLRGQLRRVRAARNVPAGTGVLLVAGAVLFAIGEASGYVWGSGASTGWMLDAELHKLAHHSSRRDAADRRSAEAEARWGRGRAEGGGR